MTITPTTPAPAVLPVSAPEPGSGDAAGPAAPGDFLAMIQQALAKAPGTSAPAGKQPAEQASADDSGQTGGDLAAALGLVAPASVPGLSTVSAGVPAAATGAIVTEATGQVPAGTASNNRPAGGPSIDPIGGTAPTAGTKPATQSASAAPNGSQTGKHRDTSDLPAGSTSAAHAAGPAEPRGAGAPKLVPEQVPAGQPPSDALNGQPGAVASQAATPAATAGAPVATGKTAHVTGQVFPEVTSLVSRGNGTHRITMTLNPEALGEVRVVMTVRDGAVHVRLAAGHDAQQALLTGSPELTRLLEHAGATDSRIVVRDLPAGSASTPGSSAGAGTGQQSPDQHAGTRADHPARDGAHDGTTRTIRSTTGANPPRSIEPVTGTRAAGVDVTI